MEWIRLWVGCLRVDIGSDAARARRHGLPNVQKLGTISRDLNGDDSCARVGTRPPEINTGLWHMAMHGILGLVLPFGSEKLLVHRIGRCRCWGVEGIWSFYASPPLQRCRGTLHTRGPLGICSGLYIFGLLLLEYFCCAWARRPVKPSMCGGVCHSRTSER